MNICSSSLSNSIFDPLLFISSILATISSFVNMSTLSVLSLSQMCSMCRIPSFYDCSPQLVSFFFRNYHEVVRLAYTLFLLHVSSHCYTALFTIVSMNMLYCLCFTVNFPNSSYFYR